MQNKNNFVPQLITITTIIVITAILGEVKITVFNSSFRFGLGSATFFFLLLFYKEVSYFAVGIFSGVFIILFRITLDFLFLDTFNFSESLINHGPIIGYYLIFSIILLAGQAKKNLDNPFYLGTLGTIADATANIVELLLRTSFTDESLLTVSNIEYVLIVALLRSFFVVGLFNMVYTRQIKAVYREQRRRYEQIQMISSGLYVEAFYLKKLLNQIEEVTAKSFDLYTRLKTYNNIPEDTATIALGVAQEVHEVKKDNQRILAGLERIIEQETTLVDMNLSDIINIMIRANQKYAKMLKKEIQFTTELSLDIKIKKIYPFVVILNNLLANSVEAIQDKGIIEIKVNYDRNNNLEIKVLDDGIGINYEDKDVIFEPGFTTKYDENGRPSTGIGLSHVKSMVNKLEGQIKEISGINRTIFVVIFPIESLQRGD